MGRGEGAAQFKSKKEFKQMMVCLEQEKDILMSELQVSEETHF